LPESNKSTSVSLPTTWGELEQDMRARENRKCHEERAIDCMR